MLTSSLTSCKNKQESDRINITPLIPGDDMNKPYTSDVVNEVRKTGEYVPEDMVLHKTFYMLDGIKLLKTSSGWEYQEGKSQRVIIKVYQRVVDGIDNPASDRINDLVLFIRCLRDDVSYVFTINKFEEKPGMQLLWINETSVIILIPQLSMISIQTKDEYIDYLYEANLPESKREEVRKKVQKLAYDSNTRES